MAPGGLQQPALVVFAAAHSSALVWALGATAAASLSLLGYLVMKCGGLTGVGAWLGRISEQGKAAHTQEVVQGGHELYRLQAKRPQNGSKPVADDEIQVAAAEWLTAIDGWLKHEAIRKSRVARSTLLAYAISVHVVSSGALLALNKFAPVDQSWFAYAAATSVFSLSILIFFSGPFIVLAVRHGAASGAD